MKEKIMLLFGILFIASGIFMTAITIRPQQYNYNGGILKQVYAAVAPDTNSTYTSDPKWMKNAKKVIINVSPETVTPTKPKSVFVWPPPRDSH